MKRVKVAKLKTVRLPSDKFKEDLYWEHPLFFNRIVLR